MKTEKKQVDAILCVLLTVYVVLILATGLCANGIISSQQLDAAGLVTLAVALLIIIAAAPL